MAARSLIPTSPQHTLFCEYILNNVQYWQDYVAAHASDIAALDRAQSRIVKAILFALDLDDAQPFAVELVESFSSYMERRGHWDVWNDVLCRAVDESSQYNDLASQVTLTALLARLLQRQGNFKEAVIYYRRTIRLAREIGDQFNEARACCNLGFHYIERSSWHRAEVLSCRALTIFKAIGSNYGQAHTENHLGILCVYQHRWSEAQHHLEQACKLWQMAGDNHGLMRGFINFGNLYNRIGMFSEALIYHKKALDQAELVGEAAEMGIILTNMAIAQKKNGDFSSAESSLWQAESILNRLADDKGLALVWHNLGWLYADQKNWPEAEHYLDTALNAARKLGDGYLEVETLIGLVKYQIAKKDRAKALSQLGTLDRFIEQNTHYEKYRTVHTHLVQDCHSLPMQNTRQAVAT